jgi:hypothetical protein
METFFFLHFLFFLAEPFSAVVVCFTLPLAGLDLTSAPETFAFLASLPSSLSSIRACRCLDFFAFFFFTFSLTPLVSLFSSDCSPMTGT